MKITVAEAVSLSRMLENQNLEGSDRIARLFKKAETSSRLRRLIADTNNESGAHDKMFKITSIESQVDLANRLLRSDGLSSEDRRLVRERRNQLLEDRKILKFLRDKINREYYIELGDELSSEIESFISLT